MKVLLDTNVVSEATRPGAETRVRDWLDANDEDDVFLSVITIAETRQGVAFLPSGRRKTAFDDWINRGLLQRYEGRILGISIDIANQWGVLAGKMRTKGYAMPVMDGFIAATAMVHSCAVATRNVRHFERFGIQVFDPWQL